MVALLKCCVPIQITQRHYLDTDIGFIIFRIQKGVLYLCMVVENDICIVVELWGGGCHDAL
ncbi:hypothetical protein QHL1GM_10255 [Halomonas sp. QHL1]|nr:hypothetical protein QHL1GM_10255 [Halomonas sp. QHL1]